MKMTPLFLALGLAMAAPAMAEPPRNSQGQVVNPRAEPASNTADRPDAWVLTKVKTKFAASSSVKASDINVNVTDGRVLLTGTVADHAAHHEAVRLAKETEGVKSVDDSGLRVTGSATRELEEQHRDKKNKR